MTSYRLLSEINDVYMAIPTTSMQYTIVPTQVYKNAKLANLNHCAVGDALFKPRRRCPF